MIVDYFYIFHFFKSYAVNEDGVAMMEAVMLFPPLLVLLLGTFDLGNGIVLAQKTVTASHIAADLVSRNRTMNIQNLNDIIEGSKLAFEPFGASEYGVDIVSIEFDQNQMPDILWRETRNMLPNMNAVSNLNGVFEEGEGIVVVTVNYKYTPKFSKVFAGDFNFSEVAFTRGRRSATVTWD